MMEPSSEVAAGGNRRSIRLKNRDYALRDQYFVTICARERSCVFGSVADGTLVPAALGRLVRECWVAIPQHFPVVTLDEFVIMPNHLHGVITLTPHEGRSTAAPFRVAQRQTAWPQAPLVQLFDHSKPLLPGVRTRNWGGRVQSGSEIISRGC